MEEELTGGNGEPVVRVGDTVRRVSGEWTPAVHALLAAFAAAGLEGTPRPLGIDDQEREILTFVPGVVLADAEPGVLWSARILDEAGRMLRRVHDAGASLVADAGLAWRSPRREPAEVVCHNDFATYNLLTRDGGLSGVIDFDYASPGPRLWDLAYLAYRIVPWAEDAPHTSGLDRDARLSSLIAAYGVPYTADEVRGVAADRLDALRTFTLGRAHETGRADFLDHAAMYGRDASRLRAAGAAG